jgi:hypothetical protein
MNSVAFFSNFVQFVFILSLRNKLFRIENSVIVYAVGYIKIYIFEFFWNYKIWIMAPMSTWANSIFW